MTQDMTETLDKYSKQLGWGLGGHQEECLPLLDMAIDELVAHRETINRLANFIMAELPGEPSESEGAIDTAIRWMRSAQMPNWQLIETAPTSEGLIIIGSYSGRGKWVGEVWSTSHLAQERTRWAQGFYRDSQHLEWAPTHWMPLPRPPEPTA